MINGMLLPALLLIALALAALISLIVIAAGIVARDEGDYSEREK